MLEAGKGKRLRLSQGVRGACFLSLRPGRRLEGPLSHSADKAAAKAGEALSTQNSRPCPWQRNPFRRKLFRRAFRAQGWSPPLRVFGKTLRRTRPAQISREESRNRQNMFSQSMCGMGAQRRLMRESRTSKGSHTGVRLKVGRRQ